MEGTVLLKYLKIN